MKRSLTHLTVVLAVSSLALVGCGDEKSSNPGNTGDQDNTSDLPDTPGDDDTTTDNPETGDESPGDTPSDTDTGSQACTFDASCSGGKTCHPDTFTCTAKTCTEDSECDTADQQGQCITEAHGVMGVGHCRAKPCTQSSQCGAGFACKGGGCKKQTPGEGELDSIVLSAPSSVILQGQSLQLIVQGFNRNGGLVTTDPSAFSFESSAEAVATVGADGKAMGTGSGTTTIKAKAGGKESNGVDLRGFGAVAQGQVRVVIYDIKSRQFINGATVMVNGESKTTAEASPGEATFDNIAGNSIDVHVFSAGHTWVSAFGLSADTRDIVIPLEPKPDMDNYRAIHGTLNYDSIPAALVQELQVGLAGPAIGGNLLDISFTTLLGDSIKRRIKLGTIIDQELGLPGGINLKIGANRVTPDGFYAFTETPDTQLWSLGGYLPLQDVISIVSENLTGGTEELLKNIGPILGQILPLLETFYHGTLAVKDVPLKARIVDTADIDGDQNTTEKVFDYENCKSGGDACKQVGSDLVLTQGLTQQVTLKFDGFDGLFGSNAKGAGAIVLAAAYVTGKGFVPLGLTASLDATTADDPGDGKLDDTVMKFAPQHGGLEGYPYYFLALGANLPELFDDSANMGTRFSAIIKRFPAGAGFDQTLTFNRFTGFPAGFSPANDVILGAASTDTKVRLNAASNNPADVHRFLFNGETNKWAIYVKAGEQFTLPALPGGFDYASVKPKDIEDVQINTMDLATGITYDTLFGFNDKNLDQLNDITDGFVIWIPAK